MALRTSPAGAGLWWLAAPADAERVVLVVHGGQKAGTQRPGWLSAPVARLVPFAVSVWRAGGGRVAVGLLRHAQLGWNGGDRMDDLRWALGLARAAHPGVPISLIGHSMGGRMVLRAAADPAVDTVVGLATWAEYSDVPLWRAGPGLRLWLGHGLGDRVTDPEGSRVAAQEFRRLGADVELELVPEENHALLRRALWWHAEATRQALRRPS